MIVTDLKVFKVINASYTWVFESLALISLVFIQLRNCSGNVRLPRDKCELAMHLSKEGTTDGRHL